MYKMLGKQKLGEGQKKLEEYVQKQGDLGMTKDAKSGGSNTYGMAFEKEGDMGKQGGTPPFDEDKGKRKGGSISEYGGCLAGAENEYTSSKHAS